MQKIVESIRSVMRRFSPPSAGGELQYLWRLVKPLMRVFWLIWVKVFWNRWRLFVNSHKRVRKLEIGPGSAPLEGFETLDVAPRLSIDYLYDASKRLPFRDNTFDFIYASHVLEHLPWFKIPQVLKEWVRVLKPGGVLEVWVPDGLKICKAFVDAEEGNNYTHLNGWYRFNPDKDPCIWASGRIYSYGDGTSALKHPNWHRALFSPRYLKKVMEQAGLVDVEILPWEKARKPDHGWINLGARGCKP